MINTVYIGADHGGFTLKKEIKALLAKSPGYEVVDLGTDSEDSTDYPQYGTAVAKKVVEDDNSVGITICGSGLGICMAASKIKGARVAHCNSLELAHLARAHNGANILSLGARTKFYDPVEAIVNEFLNTPVDPADRHKRRRGQLDEL